MNNDYRKFIKRYHTNIVYEMFRNSKLIRYGPKELAGFDLAVKFVRKSGRISNRRIDAIVRRLARNQAKLQEVQPRGK